MKNVTNDFKLISKKVKQQDVKITIDNGELTVQEIHFMPVKMFNAIPISRLRAREQVIAKEVIYSFEGQLFKSIMQQIELTVKNASKIKDKNVNFKYGLFVSKDYEYVDMGDFYIKDVEDDKNKEEITVTGYDKMLNFMVPFKQSELKMIYPCTIVQLLKRMCEIREVELYSSTFYNSNLIITEDFFTAQEITYRDVLDKIAQATLTTPFIKDNKLYMCKIGNNSVQTLDTSYLSNLVVNEKFGPLNAFVLGRGAVEDNIESCDQNSISANKRHELRFDENEILDDKRNEVIDEMFNQIKGLEYYALESSNLGLMWLEPCDIITAKDREGAGYKSIYLKARITINTGISGQMEVNIPEESNTQYKVSSKEEKKSLRVERLAKKHERIIQDVIEEQTKTSEKVANHEQTIKGFKDTVSYVEKKAVTTVEIYYALGSTTTTAPTTGWHKVAPAWQEGKHMWQKTKTTYADKSTSESTPICISGSRGQNGTDGAKGDTGIGVKKLVEQYYLSTSISKLEGGSWSTAQTKWEKGKYIWVRTAVTWTDNQTTYTDAILATNTNDAFSEIEQTKEAIKQTVSIGNFGTYVEQNAEAVKTAWNTISEFIQLMIINKNASFAILDENKKVMMSLDKLGQHFFQSDGKTIFGEMGVQKYDNKNYISFAVDGEYNKTINDGMAWGIKTKSDNKFYPILFIKNFTMGAKTSGSCNGQLVLNACDLLLEGLNTGIISGNIKIVGDIFDNIQFIDTQSNKVLLNIYPANSVWDGQENGAIDILDDIHFRSQNGLKVFYVGNDICLSADGGALCKYLQVKENATIQKYLDVYEYVNATAFNNTSLLETKKNIKEYKKSALKEVMSTDIYTFNYKNDKKGTKKTLGAVIGKGYNCSKEILSGDGKAINQYSMASLAYKAIQEQQTIIEEQRKEIKNNNKMIQDLLARVEALEKGESK